MLLFEVFRIIDSERSLILSYTRNDRADLKINFQYAHALPTRRTRDAARKGVRLLSERKEAQIYVAHKLSSVGDYFTKITGWEKCVDVWVGMLLEGLDDFMTAHGIRLHQGVACSFNSLPGSTRTSFASATSNSLTNYQGYEGREHRVCRDMALLFYLAHVLHFFAMDSSKVREVLVKESLSHWASITSILQLVCPMNGPTGLPPPTIPKPSKSSRSPAKRSTNSLSSMLTSSLQFFMPASPQRISMTVIEEQPSDPPLRASASSSKRNKARADSAWDFIGLPCHGLSMGQWRLLLLTRMRIDSLLFDILKLPIAELYTPAVPESLPAEDSAVFENEEEPHVDDHPEDEDVASEGDDDAVISTPLRPKPSAFEPMELGEQMAAGTEPGSPRGILQQGSRAESSNQLPFPDMPGEEPYDKDGLIQSPETRLKKKVRLSV